jgi:hypothetical protein
MKGSKSRFRPDAAQAAGPAVAEKSIFDEDYMAPIDLPAVPTRTVQQCSQPLSKKKINELMEQTTEEALAIPLSSSSKGFKLLQKFGYTDSTLSTGLGKHSHGTVEPIVINKRSHNNVTGIGVIDEKQHQKEIDQQRKRARTTYTSTLQATFLKDTSNKHTQQRLEREIQSIQKVIYELDTKQGIKMHKLSKWICKYYEEEMGNRANDEYTAYDPELDGSGDSDQEGIEEIQEDELGVSEDALEECLYYLRRIHCYCYYCGTRYEDEDDLQRSCPGLRDEEH